jgi:lysophospholipase L1-like esterase
VISASQPINTRRLAVALLGVVICLELTLRTVSAVWLHKPFWDDRKYVPDPHLIWKLNPGYAGIWMPLFPYLKINSLGLVGPEPRRPKGAETVRVIILGGSVQFGFGIHNFDSTSYAFLSRLLKEKGSPNRNYELLNASAPGYSSFNGRRFVEYELGRLDADVLILGFGGNDAAFDVALDKDPDKDWDVSNVSLGGALALSYILQWEEAGRQWLIDRLLPPVKYPHRSDFPRRVPISDFRDNLRVSVEICRQSGVEPILLCEPHPHGVTDRTGKIAAHQAYQDETRRVAGEMNVLLVDADSLLARYPTHEIYPDPTVQFFYPSIAGQRLMAELMFEAILKAEAVK